MDEKNELKRYANKLSRILNMGSIAAVSESPMPPNEQGFSGAVLIRLDVVFTDGYQGSVPISLFCLYVSEHNAMEEWIGRTAVKIVTQNAQLKNL